MFERHQKLNKPCLLYDIKKCAGPCIDAVEKGNYDEMLKNIENFYSGKSDIYVNNKISEMKIFSSNKNMKRPMKLRN